MPWKNTPEARVELDLVRQKAKLQRQLKKDPLLVAKLRARANAGDDQAAYKLRLLVLFVNRAKR